MPKQNRYKFLILFIILILLVSGALFYYFKFYKKSFDEPNYYSTPDSIFLRLKDNPEYLVQEELLKIDSIDLLEYFRTRMLYHKYANSDSYKISFQEELETRFPGERGRVLVELFNVYQKFESEEEKISKDKNLDEYEKIMKIEMLRFEIFGENLVQLLFPLKDSELIERFYAYSERYLKKHYTDMPRSKKNHLMKARKEIYASKFDELFSEEPTQRQFELELKINERELSILNEFEKKQAIAQIKEKMNSD